MFFALRAITGSFSSSVKSAVYVGHALNGVKGLEAYSKPAQTREMDRQLLVLSCRDQRSETVGARQSFLGSSLLLYRLRMSNWYKPTTVSSLPSLRNRV